MKVTKEDIVDKVNALTASGCSAWEAYRIVGKEFKLPARHIQGACREYIEESLGVFPPNATTPP
jgi:hypothetical protein